MILPNLSKARELQNMYLKVPYLQIEQSVINANMFEPDHRKGFT